MGKNNKDFVDAVYVRASFDPRAAKILPAPCGKGPAIFRCDTAFNVPESDLGVIKYSGSKFYMYECGETFAEARDKAYVGLSRYFASKSFAYSRKALDFADYSKFCSDHVVYKWRLD